MKKTLILLMSILVLPAAVAAAAEAEASRAVVTSASGGASVLRRGTPVQAAEGMELRKDDVITTPSTGGIDVSLNGLAGIRVLGGTEARLDDTKESDMRVNVVNGNVILNLEKLPRSSRFRLETPTAVAAVRGTQFWGRVDRQTGPAVTTFAVREGAVDVYGKAARRSFRLKQGQALDLPSGEGRIKPRAALAEEMSAMEQASTIRTAV